MSTGRRTQQGKKIKVLNVSAGWSFEPLKEQTDLLTYVLFTPVVIAESPAHPS